MQWSPKEGGGADDKPDDQDAPDDDGAPDEKDEKGGDDSTKISDEDLAMLKKADINPDSLKLLDQEARDKVIAQLKNGAEAWQKVYEVDKARKDQDRAGKRQALALAQANLIDKDGKPDLKAIATLTERATKAEGFETLLDVLVETGKVSEQVAAVIKTETPEIAAAVLKHLKSETSDVQAQIDAALKRRKAVNDDDRGGGSQGKPEDETAKHQKMIDAGLGSLMGKRKAPAARS